MLADQDPACWSWPLWEAERTARYTRWGDDAGWYLLADWHEGRCAMCGRPDSRRVCDHDHSSGFARGWLCRSCNTLEGAQPGPGAAPVIVRYRDRPPALILGVTASYVNIYGATPMRHRRPTAADTQRAVDLLTADG